MSMRLQIAVIAVLAAVVAAGWLALDGWQDAGASKAAGRDAATRVLVEPVELAEDKVVVRAIGTGEALRSAMLYPSVSGEVVEIGFTAEQRVEAGAVLLRLDDEHERLAVRLAEIAVAEARRQIDRLRKLAPSGAVAQATLDTAQAALDSARVRLDQARANLADRTVTAPFAGIIGLTDVDVGDRVSDETPLASLDDRSIILVDFTLAEQYTDRLHSGDQIAVLPWTGSQEVLTGTVSATGSRIDPVTRTLRVRAQIANPDDRIRPCTSFQVELVFGGRSYPSVREVAVLWSRDGAYVWRVTDGKADKVFVKVVRREAGRVLVEGPLVPGDVIVIEGLQGLRRGQAVETAPFVSGTFIGAGRPWHG